MIVTGGIVVIFLMNMFVCGDKSKQDVKETVQKVVNGGNAVVERAAIASKMRKTRKIQRHW